MAVFDIAAKAINIKIVYYGGALGGKTTNLETLHRLTDPAAEQGLVSIATKKDRTLFFDLLPIELGQIGGLTVRVKVYTVPGQVHYEVTRRQVLLGADAVVLVIDSSPNAQQTSSWAMENLRHNLRHQGIDPDNMPIVLQWNKRDLPDALAVSELEATLNSAKLPAIESVATTGPGVLETFAQAVKGAVNAATKKTGHSIDAQELDRVITAGLHLGEDSTPTPHAEGAAVFDRRFDAEAYRDEWAEKGRDKQIIDSDTLLTEAVQTSMDLAEKLEGYNLTKTLVARHEAMFEALAAFSRGLSDSTKSPLQQGFMRKLLNASARERGSLLLFKPESKTMVEREVVPAGADPLNASVADIGSAAYRMSRGSETRFIEDLKTEVFFDEPPHGAESLAACLVSPIAYAGTSFGALVTYIGMDERPFEQVERAYWRAASLVLGLALHWQALRQKVDKKSKAAATNV